MQNDDPLEQTLTAVGPRLRALRQQRGATLAQLTETTGVSVSTLSRLASGQRRPTQDLLLLARAHQVALDELVDAPASGDPRVRPQSVVGHGMTWLPLTRRPGGVQSYKVILPVPAAPGQPQQQTHEGYAWLYVLSGQLRLLLGDHDLTLSAGEVAEFDTRTPHWFGNAGPAAAEDLFLFGPQGERLHVRAAPARAHSPRCPRRDNSDDRAPRHLALRCEAFRAPVQQPWPRRENGRRPSALGETGSSRGGCRGTAGLGQTFAERVPCRLQRLR